LRFTDPPPRNKKENDKFLGVTITTKAVITLAYRIGKHQENRGGEKKKERLINHHKQEKPPAYRIEEEEKSSSETKRIIK